MAFVFFSRISCFFQGIMHHPSIFQKTMNHKIIPNNLGKICILYQASRFSSFKATKLPMKPPLALRKQGWKMEIHWISAKSTTFLVQGSWFAGVLSCQPKSRWFQGFTVSFFWTYIILYPFRSILPTSQHLTTCLGPKNLPKGCWSPKNPTSKLQFLRTYLKPLFQEVFGEVWTYKGLYWLFRSSNPIMDESESTKKLHVRRLEMAVAFSVFSVIHVYRWYETSTPSRLSMQEEVGWQFGCTLVGWHIWFVA